VIENAPPRIRPGWVTAIVLLTWLALGYALLSQSLIRAGLIEMPLATQQYLARLTPADWAITAAVSLMQVVAMTLLWLMRRQALWWLVASYFIGSANFARQVVTRGFMDQIGIGGPVGMILGCLVLAMSTLISAAILAYVASLYRRGALG